MLILSRRSKQSIWIGEDIEIKISNHSKGMAQIGISAPQTVKILRGELQEDKQCK